MVIRESRKILEELKKKGFKQVKDDKKDGQSIKYSNGKNYFYHVRGRFHINDEEIIAMIEEMNIPFSKIYIYDYQDKYPEFVKEYEKEEWDSYTPEHKEFMLINYFECLKEYDGERIPKSLFELGYLITNGAI